MGFSFIPPIIRFPSSQENLEILVFMEATLDQVEVYCSRELMDLASCVDQHPMQWESKCMAAKNALSRCSETKWVPTLRRRNFYFSPEIILIKVSCAFIIFKIHQSSNFLVLLCNSCIFPDLIVFRICVRWRHVALLKLTTTRNVSNKLTTGMSMRHAQKLIDNYLNALKRPCATLKINRFQSFANARRGSKSSTVMDIYPRWTT